VYAMWRSFSPFGTGNYFAQPGGDGPVSSGGDRATGVYQGNVADGET
jgi:hypothetical protein